MPDAAVAAKSRSFHWVKVDRDRVPEVPRRFSVSAYPSYLVLGERDENVHRFHGYREPAEFLRELEQGLRRYRLYRAGERWDEPEPRAAALCAAGDLLTLPAPSDDVPGGLVRVGDDLWVAQGEALYRLDPDSGAVRGRRELPETAQDLATDGAHLFVVTSRWSAGQPILVLDPRTGATVREVRTAAMREGKKHTSRGLCYRDGSLYVLGIDGDVHRIDAATGELIEQRSCGRRWVFGLAFDGRHFATVTTGKALLLLDPVDLRVVREVPTHYPLRAVGFDAGRYLLMEQPVFGFDREHRRVRVWPQPTVVHRLRLAAERER